MGIKRVTIKEEIITTQDVIIQKPIVGRASIHVQGNGLKTSNISIVDDAPVAAGSCQMFGPAGSGAADASVSHSAYSGTPYVITTIRCVG